MTCSIHRARTPAAVALAMALCTPRLAVAQAAAPGNVDTGIRWNQCYRSGSDALADCRTTDFPAQDGAAGRDTDPRTRGGADGWLGLSFRRLCVSGEYAGRGTCAMLPSPGDDQDDWGCIEDQLTGLMMEVKATTGKRARDLRYTNYSRDYDPLGQYRSPTDASGYIDGINAARLCGFHDWELGHTDKIQSVMDYGVMVAGAARVDDRFLPTTNADWYWNASLNPTSPSTAFAMDFGSGAASNSAERGTLRYVQAVRNGKPGHGPKGRYEPSEDGTEIRDTTANAKLIWRRCVEGMAWDGVTCAGTPDVFTQEEALAHAAREAASLGVPWRVPSVKELNWLVHREYASPAIDHLAFPATPPLPTWTSTPEVRSPATAWAVEFDVGGIGTWSRDGLLVLRLARDPDWRGR